MKEYFRYTYEKGKSYTCPSCGANKKYTRYIDVETEELLPEKYGKCNRVENCGYYLNPYKDGYSKGINSSNGPSSPFKPKNSEKLPVTYFIPNEILENTLSEYHQNIFVHNLKQTIPYPFLPEDVDQVCRLYQIGTIQSGYMKGATTFPFIDEKSMVRFIQVKLFDSLNHTKQTDSLTSMIERQYMPKTDSVPPWPARSPGIPKWLQDYKLNELKISCLFGAHLLPLFPFNRIALVEAPKTAIYGALCFGLPSGHEDLLWLAVYSRDTLTVAKCLALQGRKVYLFPDLSRDGETYEKWKKQAEEIQKQVPGLRIVVSDFLERIANRKSRNAGEDLADLLDQYDWRLFSRMHSPEAQNEKSPDHSLKAPETDQIVNEGVKTSYTYDNELITYEGRNMSKDYWLSQLGFIPGTWDDDLAELEKYFTFMMNSGTLPCPPIKIGNYPPIHNIHGFIKMNLETAKGQSGNPTYKPYFERLHLLRDYLLLVGDQK
jgi:hypothetical protein